MPPGEAKKWQDNKFQAIGYAPWGIGFGGWQGVEYRRRAILKEIGIAEKTGIWYNIHL
jgi:hypothetical protein